MAQHSRALSVVPEDLGSISSTHMTVYHICISNTWGPNALFWPQWIQYDAYAHTHGQNTRHVK